MLVLNSPSNPTGMIYTLEELKALAEVLKKHPQIYVVSDDMYEHIRWTGDKFYNILNAVPELKERAIILNGVSKAYAMKKVQSQSTSCPTSISQVAAEAAISGDQSVLIPMVTAFEQRCDLVVDGLNAIKGITCLRPDGAFYVYPNIVPLIKAAGLSSCTQFSEWLLEKVGVAVVPGDAFGLGGYMRISYATDAAILKEALARIEAALALFLPLKNSYLTL